jgi:hypothetical protein
LSKKNFFFLYHQVLLRAVSFPKVSQNMASSSSQNNLDLNVVPEVQPEIWRPSFLSQKGPLMTNDSVMLDDAIAASVANGIITPRDEKLLADRSDAQAINDSMAFSIQSAASVTNMA